MNAIAYETWYLGLRTTKRFLRVPANVISVIFFPLIQLLLFSQLFQQIVALPGFGDQTSYLAYLAPGQVVFAAFLAVSWSGYGLLIEYRTGYMDKLRSMPTKRWSILAAEMVPLFFQAALMAGIILVISVVLGASIITGIPGFVLILVLSGLFGLSLAGISFIPALMTKSEQATATFSLLLFPVIFISTAFVPVELMPDWMQVVNDWNPISHLIEAIRAIMTTGYDWALIGRALLGMAVIGVILQAGTVWAFSRLAR
jgi:ABC-2 type transport system permease protein